jgi:hypothetical protein
VSYIKNLDDICLSYPNDISNPNWNDAIDNPFDWRSHIGPRIRSIWNTLGDKEKMACAHDAVDFLIEDVTYIKTQRELLAPKL